MENFIGDPFSLCQITRKIFRILLTPVRYLLIYTKFFDFFSQHHLQLIHRNKMTLAIHRPVEPTQDVVLKTITLYVNVGQNIMEILTKTVDQNVSRMKIVP